MMSSALALAVICIGIGWRSKEQANEMKMEQPQTENSAAVLESIVMAEYKLGDKVEVKMPDGWRNGIVVTVVKNYAWTGEAKYSVHGKGFVTITSARSMRTNE